MMGMEQIEVTLNEAADLADPPQPRDNSRLHVSTLVNRAAKLTGNTWYEDEEPSPEGWNIMALGRIWEWASRPIIIDRARAEGLEFTPQVVREVDGIVGSLDGVLSSTLAPDHTLAVVECKSRHSSPSDPRDNWRYMCQSMAYCYMTGCTSLWMPILYLPRRGPPDSPFHLYRIEFEPHQLVENWVMLRNVRDV